MKALIGAMLAAVLGLLAPGCASRSSAEANAAKPMARGDEARVVSLSVKPPLPLAYDAWCAVMTIKNVSPTPLIDVQYVIFASQREIGRGRIPLLKPNQSITVRSDLTHSPPGLYQVQGHILAPESPEGRPAKVPATNTVMSTLLLIREADKPGA